jgi:hypothetical protein
MFDSDPDDFEESRKRLIGQLAILIGWKSGYISESVKYISLADPVDLVQHEVALILDTHPSLAAEPAIREAMELARQAAIEGYRAWAAAIDEVPLPSVSPPEVRGYALTELMKPPLTAFGPAGAVSFPEPDFGDDWEPVDDLLRLEWTGIGTPRLGMIVEAWYRLDSFDKVSEVLEHWWLEFDRYNEADCYYRWPVDDPDCGQVFAWLEDALRGERGVSLTQAIFDGLSYGLILPYDRSDW